MERGTTRHKPLPQTHTFPHSANKTCPRTQLLDEFDEELEGTSTRLAAAQKKVQAVLDRAGTKGQLAIIGFLVILLVLLVILALS